MRTKLGYQLQRGGKPFFIKGGAGLQHFDKLKAAGANSLRLYSTDYADDRINEAHRHGLTVMLGLWLEPESKLDYFNKEEVNRQKERLRQQVLRYRNHPALLAWNIGNELDLGPGNIPMYRAINDVSRMIHELDPNHPTTTSLSSVSENISRVKRLCPNLDFISVNIFGGLNSLAESLEKRGWTGAYIVTEFGGRGYWESPKTSWGTAKEQSSTEKADFTRVRYEKTILGHQDKCLGSYVFYWGNKFEYTQTWYSLFAPTGEKTATVDVIQTLWSGQRPSNLAPRINALKFVGATAGKEIRLQAGADYRAKVTATDPEANSLNINWKVYQDIFIGTMPSINKLFTPTEAIANSVEPVNGVEVTVHSPTRPGAYRLAVSVYDGKGSVATANLPFYVEAQARAVRR
ncbi:glycoside hydrolase family 2 TIM barrel-domain containing protein [Hymenobacter gelipurpurascens]|uniref:glycoside hydrolase family 2 TIM barrel-domain containing protein n=1 Tax=Hymenobacter gelipurpurascens TaxID=89968 RepID=UPI001482D459|nr:glycoside hydrolase family 2 TIM barrel-domain containing protein [Hymenobacter gelipurpurascens]